MSRVFRFLIQYEDDEDRCTKEETGGHIFTYQTSVEDNQDLPIDCCLIGQNDSTVSSSKRSVDSHTIYPARFGKELDGKTSSMGTTMSSIQSCSRRTSLVANTEYIQEWTSDHDTAPCSACSDDPCTVLLKINFIKRIKL